MRETFWPFVELDEPEEAEDMPALYDGPSCAGCGCTQLRACPGGCVWATENLCSRCALGEGPAND